MSEPTVNLYVRCSPELKARVEEAATAQGVTLTAWAVDALERNLRRLRTLDRLAERATDPVEELAELDPAEHHPTTPADEADFWAGR